MANVFQRVDSANPDIRLLNAELLDRSGEPLRDKALALLLQLPTLEPIVQERGGDGTKRRDDRGNSGSVTLPLRSAER